MKRVFFPVLFLLLLTARFSEGQTMKKLYVGTFTSTGSEGIYLCNFNTETGNISLEKTFKAIDNPSFLKISPDYKYLYTVTRPPAEVEKPGGYINAYRIKKDGSLEFLNKQTSHGNDPCHVDVSADGKFVAIANYGGGSVALYPVKTDGRISPASSTIHFEGSGPSKDRQSSPHAHSIKFSPSGAFVFSADLGTDRLNIFRIINNELVPNRQKFVKTEPGAGPRHFDFHPDGNLIYVINELNSTVSAFKYGNETWEKIQTVQTLPPDYTGTNYCADIHVSADGKYLYSSNRGHNSISVFKIEPGTGKLELQTTVSSEGDWPRNFALSANGKYMLAANQNSNNIGVFKINPETGIPKFTGRELIMPAPVCLEFLNN